MADIQDKINEILSNPEALRQVQSLGEQLGLETYTTLDGSWTDESGAQHNAFEENLAATRALMYVDIAARHSESFIVVKNVAVV